MSVSHVLTAFLPPTYTCPPRSHPASILPCHITSRLHNVHPTTPILTPTHLRTPITSFSFNPHLNSHLYPRFPPFSTPPLPLSQHAPSLTGTKTPKSRPHSQPGYRGRHGTASGIQPPGNCLDGHLVTGSRLLSRNEEQEAETSNSAAHQATIPHSRYSSPWKGDRKYALAATVCKLSMPSI